ncbi:MAG TPA: Ig-like domain-containing protein, partial [Thermoanaerobaculia bacterium]|nr:Ig-like domain-containing protein [Thermoanaerobaculia bacterium]
ILESGLPIRSGAVFFRAVSPSLRSNESDATLTGTLNGAPFTSGAAIQTSGDYTLTATAADSFHHSSSATVAFKVDLTAPPAVDITQPADRATLPGPTVDVAGTMSSGVRSVTVNGRVASLAATTWMLTALPLEPDVPNEIVAVASDANGRTATAVRTVLVRSSGPRVLILEPVEGARTNRRKIDVAGAVVGGASFTSDGRVTVTSGSASVTVALDATGAFRALDVPLAAGASTLVASTVDAQGRTGTATVHVATDFIAPTIFITADGQPLADGATFSRPFTLRVEVADDATPLPLPAIRLNGQFRATASASTDIPLSESRGYLLTVDAADTAGNATHAERAFVLDLGGCALAILDPKDGDAITAPRVTIQGKSGSARAITVRVPNPGSSPTTYQDFRAQLADGTFAAGDVPLPAVGENALQIVCEDAAGEARTETLRVVRVAGDGPAVRITAPPNGSRVSSSSVAVGGTVSDPAADVTVNGQRASTTTGAASTFSLAGAALVEGPNVLAVRAVDKAGRVGEDRVVVYRDSAAPHVSIGSPQNGATIGSAGAAGAVVDMTGLVELEAEPNLVGVLVSSPGGAIAAVVDPATGVFRTASLPLSTTPGSQPQTLTATATDSLGHSATISISVTFDPAGPAIVLSAPPDLTRVTEGSPQTFAVTGEALAGDGAQLSVNGGGLDPSSLVWGAPAADGRRHT